MSKDSTQNVVSPGVVKTRLPISSTSPFRGFTLRSDNRFGCRYHSACTEQRDLAYLLFECALGRGAEPEIITRKKAYQVEFYATDDDFRAMLDHVKATYEEVDDLLSLFAHSGRLGISSSRIALIGANRLVSRAQDCIADKVEYAEMLPYIDKLKEAIKEFEKEQSPMSLVRGAQA